MAEVVIEVVAGPLVENLISWLKGEIRLFRDANEDVEKLMSTLETIQAVLEDAEGQQIKNKQIAVWLRKLKDATYDADDVLDAWSTEARPHRLDGGFTSQVSHSVSTSLNFISRRKLSKQIKKVLSRFNEIAEEKEKFNFNTSVMPQTRSRVQTTSRVVEPHVYGREWDKQKITDMLLDNVRSSQEGIFICVILGMGGLGKTSLAQSVYNDGRVVNGFDLRFWVCVSDPFDIKHILLAIIELFETKRPDPENLETIQIKVGDILKNKRYLLVLDDVWHVNETEWNQLIGLLGGGANGSSIIVTTRLERNLAGACSIHRLGALADDDGWSLLKHGALGYMNEAHPDLVSIGNDIVKKCRGVPLAIKSLAGLLGTNIDVRHWKNIRDSEIWGLESDDQGMIMGTLRISYDHLSSPCKLCFAYCSLFPKDHIIVKEELIYLWMANNFIEPQRNKKLEQVGNDIFQKLVQLSFIEDAGEDYDKIGKYKMHDLMHDLACSVSVNECLTIEYDETKPVPTSFKHFSIVDGYSTESENIYLPLLKSNPSLRTLIIFYSDMLRLKFPPTLRVLILTNDTTVVTLPPCICDLKHLRYLDLSNNLLLKSLPKGIHKLRNLQCLILSGCRRLEQLPEKHITSLRYLDICGCDRLKSATLPDWSARVVQRSDFFYVHPCQSVWPGISELEEKNQLIGRYEIRGMENLTDAAEAKKANFRSKIYLTTLQLIWTPGDSNSSQERNIEEVLEALQLPPNIQVLSIRHYPWKTCFPQGFLRDVNALRELHFSNCSEMVPLPEGLLQNLPSLETLEITWSGSIRCLPVMGIQGSNNSLKTLEISFCDRIASLSEGLRYLTSLQTLEVGWCSKLEFATEDFQDLISLRRLHLDFLPKLTALPESIKHLTMLQEVEIDYCKNLSVLPECLQRLTALQSLKIIECHPDLYTRYNKDSHIISHIPRIDLEPRDG